MKYRILGMRIWMLMIPTAIPAAMSHTQITTIPGMARSLLISARADGSFNTHSITRRFLLFAPPCLRRDCAAL